MAFPPACRLISKWNWFAQSLDAKTPKSCVLHTQSNTILFSRHNLILRWKQKFAETCFWQVKSMGLQDMRKLQLKDLWQELMHPAVSMA